MSDTPHTPGPWVADLDMESWYVGCLNNATVVARAVVQGQYVGEEDKANAHFIAAAPDMLAALELADKLISSGEGNHAATLHAIRAAYAKATNTKGGSNT